MIAFRMGSLTVRTGLVLLACAVLLEAGPIEAGDFGPDAGVQTFDGFGLPLFNDAPLVFGDATYTSDNGTLR